MHSIRGCKRLVCLALRNTSSFRLKSAVKFENGRKALCYANTIVAEKQEKRRFETTFLNKKCIVGKQEA